MEFLSNDVDTWTNAQISIVMVCWLINFLPIIAAFWRGHPFKGKVITLTLAGLFLGLAPAVPVQVVGVIVWVIALVWSFRKLRRNAGNLGLNAVARELAI
jgi:hypothetical protein